MPDKKTDRNSEIVKRYLDGQTCSSIAAYFKLSNTRRVFRIIASAAGNDMTKREEWSNKHRLARLANKSKITTTTTTTTKKPYSSSSSSSSYHNVSSSSSLIPPETPVYTSKQYSKKNNRQNNIMNKQI
jgi:hypothetical protein